VDQCVEDRQDERCDIAECVNPSGSELANAAIAEKVDEARRRCEERDNEADQMLDKN
jgi:hypothetical protein